MKKYLHLLIAIRRKKENRGMDELCFREICRDENTIKSLITKIQDYPGTWRIYITINPRCVDSARKLLMHKLIDDPSKYAYRIDGAWKTCLLQKECKGDNRFLIDIDVKDEAILGAVALEIVDRKGAIYNTVETPNGFHMETTKFDTRGFQELFGEVEIKKDAYLFLCREVIE